MKYLLHRIHFGKVLESPFFIGGMAFALYLSTLSRNYTGGSIEFVTEIDSNSLLIIMPRHKLLVHVFGWLFIQLWKYLGWIGKSIVPLQVLNALCGAIAVLFVYLISRKLAENSTTAVITAAGFATSCGIWLFSTEAEFVTPPLAESLLVLWLLLLFSEQGLSQSWNIVILGFFTALSILTYSTNIFLVPAVVLGIILLKHQRVPKRIRQIAWYLAIVLVLCTAVYAVTFYFVYGIHNIHDLSKLSLYGGGGEGVLYGRPELSSLFFGSYSFLRSLGGFPGLGLDDHTSELIATMSILQKSLFVGYYIAILAVILSPLITAYILRKAVRSADWRFVLILAGWVVPNAAFAFYWVPKDMQFILPVLVGWWLFIPISLRAVNDKLSSRPQENSGLLRKYGRLVLPASLAFAIAVVNGFGIVLPHHQLTNNLTYSLAQSAQEKTGPDDLIITTGTDGLSLYLSYFFDRKTISVLDLYFQMNENKQDIFRMINQNVMENQSLGEASYLILPQEDDSMAWSVFTEAGLTKVDLETISPIRRLVVNRSSRTVIETH
jgi:hypothetical protein